LAAEQELNSTGVENLKWVWYPRTGAGLLQTPTPSGGDPISPAQNQSLAGKVVTELSKAIRVLRGGFGSSASHFGGGFS